MHNLKLVFSYTLLFSLLFLFSCNSLPDSTLPAKVAPNNCRINGTIVKIYEVSDKSGPCSIHPCTAEVKINNVIDAGFSFNPPLISEEIIKVKFEFTLSATSKELFPALTTSFPGLKIGDTFNADVERIELIQLYKNSPQSEYKILNYDKID